jgi:hypothetical protein
MASLYPVPRDLNASRAAAAFAVIVAGSLVMTQVRVQPFFGALLPGDIYSENLDPRYNEPLVNGPDQRVTQAQSKRLELERIASQLGVATFFFSGRNLTLVQLEQDAARVTGGTSKERRDALKELGLATFDRYDTKDVKLDDANDDDEDPYDGPVVAASFAPSAIPASIAKNPNYAALSDPLTPLVSAAAAVAVTALAVSYVMGLPQTLGWHPMTVLSFAPLTPLHTDMVPKWRNGPDIERLRLEGALFEPTASYPVTLAHGHHLFPTLFPAPAYNS